MKPSVRRRRHALEVLGPISGPTPAGFHVMMVSSAIGAPVRSLVRGGETTAIISLSEHFPEKWTPVFRRKCDHVRNLERVSDSTLSERALVAGARCGQGLAIERKPEMNCGLVGLEAGARFGFACPARRK
jgi:hypothetical protein